MQRIYFLIRNRDRILVTNNGKGAEGGLLTLPGFTYSDSVDEEASLEDALDGIVTETGVGVDNVRCIYYNKAGSNPIRVYGAQLAAGYDEIDCLDDYYFIPIEAVADLYFVPQVDPVVTTLLMDEKTSSMGGEISFESPADFVKLDDKLSQLELRYSEVNEATRKVKFIDESGIDDVQRIVDGVIAFIESDHPYLANRLEMIRAQDSLSVFAVDLAGVLEEAHLIDNYSFCYLLVNPIVNTTRADEGRCSVCGLNPVKMYGAAGIGALSNYQDSSYGPVKTLCPTCKFIATSRTSPISVDVLKLITDETN